MKFLHAPSLGVIRRRGVGPLESSYGKGEGCTAQYSPGRLRRLRELACIPGSSLKSQMKVVSPWSCLRRREMDSLKDSQQSYKRHY